MKNKFRLWLNIATICLCVCAIAIGVYAATSATLTISGTIGFQAHGIDMNVNAYMYGHSTTENGLPIDESYKVTLIGASTTETIDDTMNITGSQTLSLGTAYFSDLNNDVNGKPTDIVVEITLSATTNLKFDVMATPTATTGDTSITVTTSSAVIVKNAGEASETTKTIKFTLSLQSNAQGAYEALQGTKSVTLTVQLDKVSVKENVTVNKFDSTYQTSAREYFEEYYSNLFKGNVTFDKNILTYAERFPYYINFGKQGTTDLKWLIVGVDEGNDTITALTEEDKAILSAGYMLKDKEYYLLSENILDVDYTIDNWGLAFQNSYTNSGTYPNSAGVSANDYATSNIRAYLNSASVKYDSQLTSGVYAPKEGTEVPTFTTTYTFTPAEKAMIVPRKVTDLYKGMPTGNDSLSDMEDYEGIADNFWILSPQESSSLFSADYDSFGMIGYLSAQARVQGTSYLDYWWLRSNPNPDNGYVSWCITSDSVASIDRKSVSDVIGVRPAFKI